MFGNESLKIQGLGVKGLGLHKTQHRHRMFRSYTLSGVLLVAHLAHSTGHQHMNGGFILQRADSLQARTAYKFRDIPMRTTQPL